MVHFAPQRGIDMGTLTTKVSDNPKTWGPYVQWARKNRADDDTEIDADPAISSADDGVWIAAWVWVSDADIDIDAPPLEYTHDAETLAEIERRVRTVVPGDAVVIVNAHGARTPAQVVRVIAGVKATVDAAGRRLRFTYHDEYMAPGFRRTDEAGLYEFLEAVVTERPPAGPYRCADPACPGGAYPASEMPHRGCKP